MNVYRLASVLIAYCGGAAVSAQCVPRWSAVGAGCNGDVQGLATPRPGSPEAFLGVAGYFDTAGSLTSPRIAGYDTKSGWLSLNSIALGSEGKVVLHVDSSPQISSGLYLGGNFDDVGGVPIENLARWDGQSWRPVGQGSLTSSQVASWVAALVLYDPEPTSPNDSTLYVGGRFTEAAGQPANGFARWDGSEWSVSPGLPATNAPGITWPAIYDMTVFDDDGSGPRVPGLYVCGWIDHIAGVPMNDVARWDGQAWEPLGGGVGTTAHSLCVFDDDGPGPRPPALFVGGQFSSAGGGSVPVQRLARWDGQNWSAPAGLNSTVEDLLVWDDDGPGPHASALYATGRFGGGISKWDGLGSGWQPLGALSGSFGFPAGLVLAAWDEDGPGPNPGGLYVGGHFTMAGGVPANYIARWGCPLSTCYPDCNNDGTLNLADFGCFQTNFATGNMYADCNQDAVLNLADFGCFQTRFAVGCP